jgi:Fe-S-cluster containining protein
MCDGGWAAPLVFDLDEDSPFSFKCQACGACCHNKAITIGADEAARLARNRGLPLEEFLGLYAEEDGLTLRNRPDGSCVFLEAGRCAVHPDRPLVCRMFPLGLITDGQGRGRYGCMPLHPDCLGIADKDRTVAIYLVEQGASPYLARLTRP